MFNWFFGKTTAKTRVDDIVQLMRCRPLEWEFSERSYNITKYNYKQDVTHNPSNLSLSLFFQDKDSLTPTQIQFNAIGQVPLSGKESALLIEATEGLRHSRFNAVATHHLKLDNKIDCCQCESKIVGWAWICKCQNALDQNCYGNATVCPSCGGTLVSGS